MVSAHREAEDFAGILDGYSEPLNYNQGRRDDELASRLNQAFLDSHETKSYIETEWESFRQYLKGEQILVHKFSGEIIRLSPEDSRNLRSNNNIIRPTHRSYVGKLTRDIPIAHTIPSTSDFEEQHGARVADSWLEWFFQKEALEIKFIDTCEFLSWAGNGFMLLEWDATAGRELSYCEVCEYAGESELIGQPCPDCSMQRDQELQLQAQEHEAQQMEGMADVLEELPLDVEPSPDMLPEDVQEPPPLQQLGPLPPEMEPPPLEPVNEGRPCVKVIDPRWVFIEPGATSLTDAQWYVIRFTRPVAEVRAEYPEFARYLHAESDVYSDHTSQIQFDSSDLDANENKKDHLWEYEYYEKPTPAYPKGRIITKINGIIVEEKDFIYFDLFKRPNLFHFYGDHNSGEFWGEPWIKQAWHRQRELNNVEQQIREYVELVVKPKLLNPMGSRVAPGEWTADTAQNISYNPAVGKPEFTHPPQLGPDVWNRGATLEASIREKGAVTEQESGKMSSDPNGRAMAIVEAEADQQLGPQTKRMREQWRQLQKCALVLFQKFGNPDSKWTIVGKDGLNTYAFDEMKLSEGWDLIIEDDSGLPHNKALRMQSAMDIMNVGGFTDMQTGVVDMKAFQKVAGINLPMSGYDIEAVERAAASQIPYKLERGEQHFPQFEDDPQIFAEELGAWLRGPGRRPETDEMLRIQVRQLWQFYTFWAQTQMMGEPPTPETLMQLQQNAQGVPDMSGRGGSANGPGHMGSDVRAQAGAQVQQADNAAESAGQVQLTREG